MPDILANIFTTNSLSKCPTDFSFSPLFNQEPVEKWPVCDCLISFHSKGFPLEKAQAYTELRKPYIINNLDMQYDLQVSETYWYICILTLKVVMW